MRSCIYCGKELEKGEKCTCAKSAGHREKTYNQNTSDKKNNQSQDGGGEYKGTYQYNDPNRTQYQTGYTHKDSPFKRAYEKAKARSTVRKNRGDVNVWKVRFGSFMEALRDPVAAVHNPKDMSMATMALLWAILGAVMWLCMYFIITNVPRGPFAMLANIMSFNGVAGYAIIAHMFMAMLSGAASGIILFFVYTGVFYAINRFVFRDRATSYKAFCQRLSMTAVPFTAVCIIGALISMFSSLTLLVLLLCGMISFVILTYEALKAQWAYVPPGKVIYGMILGMFILITLMCYVVV